MKTLTKRQQEELDQLKRHGPLYVGYHSKPVMNVFEKLVSKGYVKIVSKDNIGKEYAIKKER